MYDQVMKALDKMQKEVEESLAGDYSTYELLEDEIKTLEQYRNKASFTFDDYRNIRKRKGYKPTEKRWLSRAKKAKSKYPKGRYSRKEDVPEYSQMESDLGTLEQRAKETVKEDIVSGNWIHRRTQEIADQSVYFDDEYHNKYEDARSRVQQEMQSKEMQDMVKGIGAWDALKLQLEGKYDPTSAEKEARYREELAYQQEQERLEQERAHSLEIAQQKEQEEQRREADRQAKAEQAERTAMQANITKLTRKIERATIHDGIENYLSTMQEYEAQGYDIAPCQRAVEQYNAKVDRRRQQEQAVLSRLRALQKEMESHDEQVNILYKQNTTTYQKDLDSILKSGKYEFKVLTDESKGILDGVQGLIANRQKAYEDYEAQIKSEAKPTIQEAEPKQPVGQPKPEPAPTPVQSESKGMPEPVVAQPKPEPTLAIPKPAPVPVQQESKGMPDTAEPVAVPQKPRPAPAVADTPKPHITADNSKLKIKAVTAEQREEALFIRMLEYLEEKQKVSSQIHNKKFQEDLRHLLKTNPQRKQRLKAVEDKILKKSASSNAVKVQDLRKSKVYISKYGFCIYKGYLKKEKKYVFDVISQNRTLGRMQSLGKQIKMTNGYDSKTMFKLTQGEVSKNICWGLEKGKEYPAGTSKAIYRGMGTTNSYHFELYKESGEVRKVTFTFDDIYKGRITIDPDLGADGTEDAMEELNIDNLKVPVPTDPDFFRLKLQGMNKDEIIMTKYGTQQVVDRKVVKGKVRYVVMDIATQQAMEITPEDIQSNQYAYRYPTWQTYINVNGSLCFVKNINLPECKFEVLDLTCMKVRTIGYSDMKRYPMEPATDPQKERISKKIQLDSDFEESFALHVQGAQVIGY